MVRFASFVVSVPLVLSLHTVSAHESGKHDLGHHSHNYDDHEDNLRRLGLFDEVSHQKCGTPDMTSEQQAKADEDFQAWKEGKEGSRVGVDWSTTVITIPTYFHVIHSGTTGKQYTYASSPAYIQDQIKALNVGFRGEESSDFTPNPAGRSYDRYSIDNAGTKIQFCLAGTTATDKASWYALTVWSSNVRPMKQALRKGGRESLNVFVSSFTDGTLGFATFPTDPYPLLDGVVLLNESMPNSPIPPYNEGDTLTHEVGHWLNLRHTFEGRCAGPGDYMDLAPPSPDYTSVSAKEKTASFECPVNLDDCATDGGKKNPIHSFMSYVDDNCMDQFTPGQVVVMQQAWEMYRHKLGYSEHVSIAADGFSCDMSTLPPTNKPTPKPPSAKPTRKPTRKPTKKPTKKPLA